MSEGFGAYAVILESAPEAIIAIDGERRVISWNSGAEEIYGYRADEAVGASLAGLVVPPGEPDGLKALGLGTLGPLCACEDGETRTGEALRRRRDGRLLFIGTTAHATMCPEKGCVITLHETDITLMRALRDERAMSARFGETLALMPDPVLMLNATGHVVLANKRAEVLFGYAPGQLIGETAERLLPDRVRGAYLRHRSGQLQQNLELHGVKANGEEIPLEISLGPVQAPEGTFVLTVIRDATARRRFESILRDRNVQLAAAMQAKDRFLATMSHELRTPLNAVIGFTGTLLMRLAGPLNDEQEKQLRTIQSSGRHLLSLINDLLDLARIDADKLPLAVQPIDCRELVEEVMGALRPQAETKGLAIHIVLPERRIIIETDRRALTQILTNLAANAVKFCDAGSVTVAVSQGSDAGASVVRFAVVDTGPGIRAEDIPTVFDAFSRIEASSATREGSGLGLHISRRLAERLAGRIELVSELGKGSVFTLILPGG